MQARKGGSYGTVREKELEDLGETFGCADHDHDLIHELSRCLDSLWRIDQYIARPNRRKVGADLASNEGARAPEQQSVEGFAQTGNRVGLFLKHGGDRDSRQPSQAGLWNRYRANPRLTEMRTRETVERRILAGDPKNRVSPRVSLLCVCAGRIPLFRWTRIGNQLARPYFASAL